MAKDIGFENTSPADAGPAVALRIASDKAIVHNCHMSSFQDTLFAQVYRQFYRDCEISGTIDFIFGGGITIFQNCKIITRKPALGQADLVLAHARHFANDVSGIVLDGCSISSEPDVSPDKGVQVYLGRPWKPYSKMLVINSQIEGSLSPAGWDVWTANEPNTENSYIVEYNNKGPGADVSKRVTWPSIKKITPQEASTYTPSGFLKGDSWIPVTGVPSSGCSGGAAASFPDATAASPGASAPSMASTAPANAPSPGAAA